MVTTTYTGERIRFVSNKPFDDVVAQLSAKIGHPSLAKFNRQISEARTDSELKAIVESTIGP
jgi:hypothetical protein